MQTIPEQPTDAVLSDLVAELCTKITIFGRSLGAAGTEERFESTHPAMQPDIPNALVGAYLGGEPYMPGAQHGIPAEWRTLRHHTFERVATGATIQYVLTEYLPIVERLSPGADAAAYQGIAASTFAALVDGLKKSLGKPRSKAKQKVEYEWGVPYSPTHGGLRVQLGGSKQLDLGGGDAAPWAIAHLTILLYGAPRG